jgi:low temperature requirement protein LtrA
VTSRPPGEASAGSGARTRVSTLELFFDLVFVFVVTQLTTLLGHDASLRGALRALLLLTVIWWMYGGYAWLTNAVSVHDPVRRVLLLGGMASFLVLGFSVPRAFSGSGIAFGAAYLCVVLVHAILFISGSPERIVRSMRRIGPLNVTAALVVLVAGSVGGVAQYVLLVAAIALTWGVAGLTSAGGFAIAPEHFVERHGLVVLIAIGESVVAIGVGAGEQPIGIRLVAIATLALLLNACLWWAYFGGDDARAEAALHATPVDDRPRRVLIAFGYWHVPLLLGIVAAAAGVERIVEAPGHHVSASHALLLGGGVATFLVGDVLFRRTLAIGPLRYRALAAPLVLAAVLAGTRVGGYAEAAMVVVVLAGAFACERRPRSGMEPLS